MFHLAALARVQPSIEDPITFNKVNVELFSDRLILVNKKSNYKTNR